MEWKQFMVSWRFVESVKQSYMISSSSTYPYHKSSNRKGEWVQFLSIWWVVTRIRQWLDLVRGRWVTEALGKQTIQMLFVRHLSSLSLTRLSFFVSFCGPGVLALFESQVDHVILVLTLFKEVSPRVTYSPTIEFFRVFENFVEVFAYASFSFGVITEIPEVVPKSYPSGNVCTSIIAVKNQSLGSGGTWTITWMLWEVMEMSSSLINSFFHIITIPPDKSSVVNCM